MIVFYVAFIISSVNVVSCSQGWFAQGGSPFIGVIVNPYNKQTPSHHSQFKCLVVCSDGDVDIAVANTGEWKVPLQFL